MGVVVADSANRVSTGRGSELEGGGVGAADEDVSVVWAATAFVDAEGVVNWDVAAEGPAEGGLGGGGRGKEEEGEEEERGEEGERRRPSWWI